MNSSRMGYRQVANSHVQGESPTPGIPTFVVLPSRELVLAFRQQVPISERNLVELLTQIFDGFMEAGLHEPLRITPVLTMLIMDSEMGRVVPEVLHQAFEALCHGLRACLCELGFPGIVRKTNGEFNYCFHSLRGNDIVVTYLSTEHRI